MAVFLPDQDHLDYEVGALFRSHNDMDHFQSALHHTVSTLTWQGGAAKRFKSHFGVESGKLSQAVTTMHQFATAYQKLVDDVTTLKGAITRAESEVTDALHKGHKIPDNVWHKLGLQPNQLPPHGAVEWIDLARAVGDNPVQQQQQAGATKVSGLHETVTETQTSSGTNVTISEPNGHPVTVHTGPGATVTTHGDTTTITSGGQTTTISE